MRFQLTAVTIGVFSLLCTQAAVWGQGTRTMFGSSSTLGSALTAGTRTFGSGSSFGTSGTTGGSASQLGAGGGQSAVFQQFLRGAQQGEFVGSGSQQGQGFAGTVQAGQNVGRQSQQSGPSPRRATGASGAARSGATASPDRRTSTQIRTRIRLAFGYPKTLPARVSTALAERLAQMKRIRTLSPVKVSIQGETATLRGVVATDYDRELAELLARLEPGVWQVKNELVVAAAPAAPEGSAPNEAPAVEAPAAEAPAAP